jgi:hypothetical protein
MINNWITLAEQKNGINIQRKFAGLHTEVDEENNVLFCRINYFERELYPNGLIMKTTKKTYSLENLSEEFYNDENGVPYKLSATTSLNYYIENVGQPSIINPVNEILQNTTLLPAIVEDNYPLNRDTRTREYNYE